MTFDDDEGVTKGGHAMWKYILGVFFVASGAAIQAHAADRLPPRVDVSVTCNCDDAMGRAYGEAVRALLANNTHYRQIAQQADEQDTLRIHIISMPITTSEGAAGSALSIVCVHHGVLMHEFLTTCEHIPITECAKNMVDGLSDMESE